MNSPLYPDLARDTERAVLQRIFPTTVTVSQCGRPLSPAELNARIAARQSTAVIDPDAR